MKYDLEVKDEARKEIIKAYLYYEKEQTGLGERFLTNLDKYFNRIENNPNHFPEKRPPYREAFMQVFHYLIIYEISENNIVVYSVFHTRRDSEKKP